MMIQVNDNISLELLDGCHAAETFALINANRIYLREWLPWVDNMRTITIFENYISKTKKEKEAGTDIGFVILYNGVITGRIGIHYINQQNKSGAIGYWLGEHYAGKGIITACCKKLIDVCFTQLDLERIEIKCATGNHKSKAVAERLGFTQEAILPQAEFVNDQVWDLYLYAFTKTEWLKQRIEFTG